MITWQQEERYLWDHLMYPPRRNWRKLEKAARRLSGDGRKKALERLGKLRDQEIPDGWQWYGKWVQH